MGRKLDDMSELEYGEVSALLLLQQFITQGQQELQDEVTRRLFDDVIFLFYIFFFCKILLKALCFDIFIVDTLLFSLFNAYINFVYT